MMKVRSATLKNVDPNETIHITVTPNTELDWVGRHAAILFDGDETRDITEECFYAGGWKIDLSKYPSMNAVIKLTIRPLFTTKKINEFAPFQVEIEDRLSFSSNCLSIVGREAVLVEINKNKKGVNFKIFG